MSARVLEVQPTASAPATAPARGGREPTAVSALGAGRPLTAPERASAPRLAHLDLGKVRIHADREAAQAVSSQRAVAFAMGDHIAVDPASATQDPRRWRQILAHELTHVSRRREAPPALRRQDREDAGSAPYYQELIDLLAEERAGEPEDGRPRIELSMTLTLEALLALVKALDGQPDPGTVRALMDELLRVETPSPSQIVSTDLIEELIARMVALGVPDEVRRLLAWRAGSASPIQAAGEIRLLSDAALAMKPSTARAALGVLEVLTASVEMLGDAPGMADDRPLPFSKERPNVQMLEARVTGAMSAMQVVLDEVIALLGTRGDAAPPARAEARELLDRLTPLETRLEKAILQGDARHIADRPIQASRSSFEAGGGAHYDYFQEDRAETAPHVEITFYNKAMKPQEAKEMESTAGELLLVRRSQIEALIEIFGLQQDEHGAPTKEASAREAVLKASATGGLDLHNDDDWRAFALALFERELSANRQDRPAAYLSVIYTLERYLQTYTAHTPYNIDDFKEDQLSKTFPRTLSGQLIHDCGVYALRAAYILSLLRDRLDLSFTYIRMPLHVSLLITGPGLPIILVENDRLTPWSESEMLRAQLGLEPDAKLPDVPLDQQRLEARAAGQFVPDVDVPYQSVPVVDPTGGAEGPAANPQADPGLRSALWQQYKRDVAPIELFGPRASDTATLGTPLDLRYLKLLDLAKEHHNRWLLAFWNLHARKLWLTWEPVLEDTLKLKQRGVSPVSVESLQKADWTRIPCVAAEIAAYSTPSPGAAQAMIDADVPFQAAMLCYLDLVYDSDPYRDANTAYEAVREAARALQAEIEGQPGYFSSSAQIARAEEMIELSQNLGTSNPEWMSYRQIDERYMYGVLSSKENGAQVWSRYAEILTPI